MSVGAAGEATAFELTADATVLLFENGQTTRRTLESARRIATLLGFQADVSLRWGEVLIRLESQAGSMERVVAAAPLGVDMGKVAATLDTIDKLSHGELDAEAAATALRSVAHRPPISDTHFAVFAAAGAAALSVIFGVTHTFAVVVIALSAGAGGYMRRWLGRKSHNPFVQPFSAALLAGAVGALASYLGLDETQRLVAVCPCMVLVPGPHILNGALDLARAQIQIGRAHV